MPTPGGGGGKDLNASGRSRDSPLSQSLGKSNSPLGGKNPLSPAAALSQQLWPGPRPPGSSQHYQQPGYSMHPGMPPPPTHGLRMPSSSSGSHQGYGGMPMGAPPDMMSGAGMRVPGPSTDVRLPQYPDPRVMGSSATGGGSFGGGTPVSQYAMSGGSDFAGGLSNQMQQQQMPPTSLPGGGVVVGVQSQSINPADPSKPPGGNPNAQQQQQSHHMTMGNSSMIGMDQPRLS